MRAPRILAVDIGASHVVCGTFTVGVAGRLVLQEFAVERHTPDPARDARWADDLAQSLGATAARQHLGGACALAVPGHLALTKFVKSPSIEAAKRAKIVAFEAAENIPYPLGEVVWDHVVVADDGLDLEIMLTAAKTEAMQTVCVAADAAGFAAERALPAGLALCHAFRYNHPDVRQSVIVANVGARSTTLLFLEDDRFYLRTLALAGNAVTQGVADELRIDFAQAEALKVQVLSGRSDLPAGSPARAAVQHAVAGFAQKLALETTRSTVNHRRQSGGAQPVALYLAGGGALIEELPRVLAEKLKLPVERYEPLRRVDLSADARAAGAEGEAHLLADLVGLATRLVTKDEPEASLLPPSLLEALAFRKRQPVLLAAAALFAAALLPPIFYFHRVATVTLAKAAQVEGQLMPLRGLNTRNTDNLAKIEAAKQEIAALQGAVETKSNWINFFTDLQTRVVKVEDVWLDKLQLVRPSPPEPGAAVPAGDPAATDAPAAKPPPPLKLALSGRLLDVTNPQSKVSQESFDRVKQLLASFAGSQFIAAVENERFDNGQNGLLRFDFTLVVDARKPL